MQKNFAVTLMRKRNIQLVSHNLCIFTLRNVFHILPMLIYGILVTISSLLLAIYS